MDILSGEVYAMRKQFEDYLIKQGYAVKTPSGKPSAVYDYIKRIDKVCEIESITWHNLAMNISEVVIQYDSGGCKENIGKQSHHSVINALKRFSEFLKFNRHP